MQADIINAAGKEETRPESTGAPLRVLHVCSIKGRGGTGYMAGHLCRLLRERGHEIAVAACAGSKVAERAAQDGLPLLEGLQLRRGLHPVSLLRDIALLRRYVTARRVQIVHAWHSIEYWTCAAAIAGTGAKLARTRGLVTPVRPHFFNRLIHNRTAALLATCGKIEALYRESGLRSDNLFRLQDGVDTARFSPGRDGSALRRELGIPPEAFVVANVGRTEPVKGQRTLLDALARLEGVHAVIAGDGSLRTELARQAEASGAGARVHFLGVRGDVENVLAAADVYTLCSVGSEGSSRATLEAMACALPCVTTGVGMLPDIVKPGITGLLFSPGNAEQLAECLANLANDSGMRRRLGAAARRLVEERHSETAMALSVETAYLAALGQAQPLVV